MSKLPPLHIFVFKKEKMKTIIPFDSSTLTPREHQVIGLLCDGLKYRQVGLELNISAETVRKHAANIYKKLGVKNRTQAMIKVYLEV